MASIYSLVAVAMIQCMYCGQMMFYDGLALPFLLAHYLALGKDKPPVIYVLIYCKECTDRQTEVD